MKVLITLLSLVAVSFGAVVSNLCPPEQAYDWTIEKLLPHEECGKYYQCTHGRPIERICPAGLHFNVKENYCDWPYLAQCTEGLIVVPAIVDEDESEEVPQEEVPHGEVSEEKEEEKEEENEEENEGESEKKSKPQGIQMFNAFVNFENEEDFNTDLPEIITPEPTTPAPIFGANGCPIDPYAHWLLPHEADCNKFYSCVWGQKVEMKCLTPNLHFNPAIQVCDWPSNAGCQLAPVIIPGK